MEIFDLPEFDGHELIVFGHDAATSLRAIIAIHSTALGPAAGGCRMWPYATTADAVCDALRLSRGMSYKNALAGMRSEEHTSELQSRLHLVCRLLLEKKKTHSTLIQECQMI